MKKLLVFSLLVIIMVAGCTPATPAPTEPAKPAETEATSSTTGELKAPQDCKIGINNFGQANFFARIGKAALEDELKKLGCEVIATVTADVTSRTAAIEDMVSQGVDAIIIQEGDVNEVAPALKEAKAAGIIIGSMDGGTGDFIDYYVSSDNTALGTMIAEEMVKAIGGKGNVVEIFNDAGSMIRLRKEAMHKVIEAYPDIKITDGLVYSWPDFYPDIKSKMESLLQAKSEPGDISAVFATFDGVGVAAADAIREAGLQESIVVVGIDGDPNAYNEMRKADSPFIATAAQDPDTIARETVWGVIRLLNGETLPDKVKYIPGILITKDNIPDVTE